MFLEIIIEIGRDTVLTLLVVGFALLLLISVRK